MKSIGWNLEKADLLKKTREIEFEKVAILIEEEHILGVANVPTRENQQMFLVDYDDYLVCVPFVETETEIFLKTAYRNRKFNKTLKAGE